MKQLTPCPDEKKATQSADYCRALEADVLARTLWGEARGEGPSGMLAVAAVILNRVAVARQHGAFWWGNDIIEVCQKPYQFSCWNKSDPNFRRLSAVDDRDIHFATALRLARRAVIGAIDDPTGGATHYHARDISPVWSIHARPCAVIGRHVFYRIES